MLWCPKLYFFTNKKSFGCHSFVSSKELCSDLRLDSSRARSAWAAYEEVSTNYSLEGNPLHWLCCAIFLASRFRDESNEGKPVTWRRRNRIVTCGGSRTSSTTPYIGFWSNSNQKFLGIMFLSISGISRKISSKLVIFSRPNDKAVFASFYFSEM